MFRLITLLSLCHLCSSQVTYSIATTWDGVSISDHDLATVTLDVDADGQLWVEASAPFFNSPVPPQELFVYGDQQCPQRPVGNLYNYEVLYPS